MYNSWIPVKLLTNITPSLTGYPREILIVITFQSNKRCIMPQNYIYNCNNAHKTVKSSVKSE